MRTTLKFEGMPELILEKAVDLGIARSKTDALRLGIFALNREYNLIKDLEMELVKKTLIKEKQEMEDKGIKYISKEKALSKYK